MAGVVVPSFSSLARMPRPQSTPSAGTIAAQAAAGSLLSISSGLQQSLQTKRQLNAFAGIIEKDSPEKAAAYRSMADNTPLISFGPNTGMGAAGGGPGGGGIGSFTKDMLDTLDQVQRQKDALALDAARTQNNIVEIGARSAADLERVYAMGTVRAEQERIRGDLRMQLEETKAKLLEPKYELEWGKLDAKKAQLENALKIADMQQKASLERSSAMIDVAKERTNATVMRSLLGPSGAGGKPTANGAMATDPVLIRDFAALQARKQQILNAPASDYPDKGSRERALKSLGVDEKTLQFRADQAARGLTPRATTLDGALPPEDEIDKLLRGPNPLPIVP